MELSELLSLYASTPEVKVMEQMFVDNKIPVLSCNGAKGSSSAVLLSSLVKSGRTNGHVLLLVLDDEEMAGYFYHDLVQLTGDDANILFFPSSFRRSVRYGQRDAANEVLRTEVLSRLVAQQKKSILTNAPLVVVGYPESYVEKVAEREGLSQRIVEITEGGHVHLTDLEKYLMNLGFKRCDYVYEPGQFAVRGSIFDIFSFTAETPYRIDFFGDDIETIRSFEVSSQLSGKRFKSVTIAPDMADSGVDKVVFFKVLPQKVVWAFHDFKLASDRVTKIVEDGFSSQAKAETESLDANDWLTKSELVCREWIEARRIEFHASETNSKDWATCSVNIEMQPLLHKNFDMLRQLFVDYTDRGYKMYVLSDSEKQHERLRDIFMQTGDGMNFVPVHKTLHEGFIDHQLKCCFLTDHQIFDRFYKYNLRSDKARSGKVALSLKEILQFSPGDYVVHMDHGVGQFAGLVRMPSSDGGTQEVMKLVYKGGDVVLVSIHSLHKVSKYKGKENQAPVLSHLGTGAWDKLKERAKKHIKDIARDLIKLYSERMHETGYAFSVDNFMQHELEASFLYEDTPDQLRVTQEVKTDMERARPMDRLVCGDVGFGKTEIAVRAAFKAVCDNKQVAVMVPTTVLALQHYKTFKKRLKNFPVKVEYLSRARTTTQTRQVLKQLSEGNVGIIVGTHKLIGKSVKFHDLGLLIIDEEQKFGVSVKEKLRQLKPNVDTLTLSATPIPRTLQFSLMGARDFSVMQTPPPNRRPIQTEIHTFGHEIIAEAVQFELSRNGQVYVVAPRISTLGTITNLIHKYVPDARVAIGHGQMPPAQLEEIITGFVNYDFDVLVCTTIVENGVDIPNANTIIIDGAHHFGLSDLHQMRGRVGRSDKKAFCYLLAPPLGQMPEETRRRLQALENFSDLGSGIHIAMQDLDIRGAGNLLGSEQSGFVADLGYETYRKILSQAVTELKNDEFSDLYAEELAHDQEITGEAFVDDCTLECDLKAFLPEVYVPGSGERMMLYRELDSMNTDEQVIAFRSRLEDRFGTLPSEAEELLRIVRLRRLGRRLGVERILLKNGRMMLNFVSNTESPFYKSAAFERIINYAMGHIHSCKLMDEKGKRKMRFDSVKSVKIAVDMLQMMAPQTREEPLPKQNS